MLESLRVDHECVKNLIEKLVELAPKVSDEERKFGKYNKGTNIGLLCRYFNQASLLYVSDTEYIIPICIIQSTLRLESVTKICKNELSHSCASQTSSPVDDGNPAGMQVCTENNCLDIAGISDDSYNDMIKKKNKKTKLQAFPVLGSRRRGTL